MGISGSGKIGGKLHLVSLRSVILAMPQDEAKKIMLVEDLTRIGCKGLLIHPWSLRSEEMVRKFFQERSNKWEDTLRRDLEKWTAELWAEMYNFPKERRGWAYWTDKFAFGKFSTPVNPKDGYAIADCENPRERRVLEFVVPIPYLEKPTRITLTISNTTFGTLSGTRLVI